MLPGIELGRGDQLHFEVESRVVIWVGRDDGSVRRVTRRCEARTKGTAPGPQGGLPVLVGLKFADETARELAQTATRRLDGDATQMTMTVLENTPEKVDPWVDATTERERIVKFLREDHPRKGRARSVASRLFGVRDRAGPSHAGVVSMTEVAMSLLPLGVATILWVVLNHRSAMEHLRARRDGSLDRDEYRRGVRDGMLRAAKIIETNHASPKDVNLLKAAAD